MGGWWKDVFVHGSTDQNGVVEMTARTGRYETFVKAELPGYYRSKICKFMMTGSTADHWEPWPVEVNLVMKKIRNPHPMYALEAKDAMKFSFPNGEGREFGFDLMVGDWVAPHGKGIVADFVLSPRKGEAKEDEMFPPGTMLLAFSNSADGIIAVPEAPVGGSSLASPTEAPPFGYLKEWEFSNRPSKDGLFPGLDPLRRVWVIRVRSKVDEKGNFVSAYYGKISGHPEILFFPHAPAFRMTWYLNDTKNERNLEWDLKTNLFKNLDRIYWPMSP